MARINVYLPDELASAARDHGLNVSRITQHAIREALAASEIDRWLASVPPATEGSDLSHDDVIEAIEEARADFGDVS